MAAVGSGARRSRAQWQSLIAGAERSPLSVRRFCASQGISTASFYLWRRRLVAEAAAPMAEPVGFLDLGELDLQAPAGEQAPRPSGAWELELALGQGLVLRLRRR